MATCAGNDGFVLRRRVDKSLKSALRDGLAAAAAADFHEDCDEDENYHGYQEDQVLVHRRSGAERDRHNR